MRPRFSCPPRLCSRAYRFPPFTRKHRSRPGPFPRFYDLLSRNLQTPAPPPAFPINITFPTSTRKHRSSDHSRFPSCPENLQPTFPPLLFPPPASLFFRPPLASIRPQGRSPAFQPFIQEFAAFRFATLLFHKHLSFNIFRFLRSAPERIAAARSASPVFPRAYHIRPRPLPGLSRQRSQRLCRKPIFRTHVCLRTDFLIACFATVLFPFSRTFGIRRPVFNEFFPKILRGGATQPHLRNKHMILITQAPPPPSPACTFPSAFRHPDRLLPQHPRLHNRPLNSPPPDTRKTPPRNHPFNPHISAPSHRKTPVSETPKCRHRKIHGLKAYLLPPHRNR